MWINEVKVVSVREEHGEPQVMSPRVAVEYWMAAVVGAPWYDADKECVVVLLLDTQNRVVGHNLVSLGGLDEAMAFPREVYRAAVVAAAKSIVLMHNHPDGNTTPSAPDIATTRTLVGAGQVLGIRLNDHIIVGRSGGAYTSLRASGLGGL